MKNNNKKLFIWKFIITIMIIALLSIPWYKFNLSWPSYMFGGKVILELNYIIALFFLLIYLILFIFSSNKDNVYLYGVNEKILINGMLIALAYNHSIAIIIPLVYVIKDIMVLSLRAKVTRLDNISNIIMFIGFIFLLLGNIPFEFLNVAVDQGLIIVALCLAVYSGTISVLINQNKLKEDN